MKNTVKIYQNIIHDNDFNELDPSFIPNDWRHNPTPELFEIAIFFDFYEKNIHKQADYVGAVSKKFFRKTKVPGKKFIDYIQNNPGYDVYFINPFPQISYYAYNIWEHGESCHKGICDLTQYLFDSANIPLRIDEFGRNNHKNSLCCNYWVGSATFWEGYISFLRHLFNTIQNMPVDKKNQFFASTSHDNSYVPMFPFIFERLFSTYLSLNKNIKYLAYPRSGEEIIAACFDDRERHIYKAFGSLIDALDASDTNSKVLKELTGGLLSLLPYVKN